MEMIITGGDRLMNLPIDQLYYKPSERHRQEIIAVNIDALMASIRDHGLINPITVYMPLGQDPPYEILAGVTRYTACKALEHISILCRVYTIELSIYQRKAIELEENIRRTNLTDTEKSIAIDELHQIMIKLAAERGEKHTQTDTAIIAGISQASVNNHLQVAKKAKHLLMNSPGVDVRNLSPTKITKDYERTLAEMNNKILATKVEASRPKSRSKPPASSTSLPMPSRSDDNNTENEEAPSAFDPQKIFDVMDSYVVGDFFSNDLPDASYAFIECDPPYGINLPEMRDAEYKGSLESNYTEITDEDYPSFLRKLVKELYRLASPDSNVIIWHSLTFNNLLNEELSKVGFLTYPHHIGIWKKGNTSGQSRHPDIMLGYSCEYFVFARKGHASLQPKGRGRSNVFDFNKVPPSVNKHPTERPLALMLELLDCYASPGGNILVPFAGSGVTLLASGLRNLPAIGYDLSEAYKHQFARRVMDTPEFRQMELKL